MSEYAKHVGEFARAPRDEDERRMQELQRIQSQEKEKAQRDAVLAEARRATLTNMSVVAFNIHSLLLTRDQLGEMTAGEHATVAVFGRTLRRMLTDLQLIFDGVRERHRAARVAAEIAESPNARPEPWEGKP